MIKLLINNTPYSDNEIIEGVKHHLDRSKRLDVTLELIFPFDPNGYVVVITDPRLTFSDELLETNEKWVYMDISKTSGEVCDETTDKLKGEGEYALLNVKKIK